MSPILSCLLASSRRLRPRGVATATALLCLAATAATATDATAAPRDRWPSHRYASVLAQADSMRARRTPGIRAYLDSTITAARASRNSELEMVASLYKTSMRAFAEGAFDSAVATSRLWLGHIRASSDTQSWCVALRTIGYCALVRDQYRASEETYRQMLGLSQRARLPIMEGYARIGLSFLAIKQARFSEAERGYRIAIRRLEHADSWAARTAHAGLANALLGQQKVDLARQEYEGVVADARAAHDPYNEADALNDLAEIELLYGDPSLAMPLLRATAVRQRALGREVLALRSLAGVVQCLDALGRTDEQVALADSVRRRAAEIGSYDIAVGNMIGIAVAQRGQRRLAEAEATLREALRFADSVSVPTRLVAVTELVRLETLAGNPDRAVQTARAALAPFGRPGPSDLLDALGCAEMARGNLAEAVTAFRRSTESAGAVGGLTEAKRIRYETSLAGALAASGERDSALVHFRRAAQVWERLRAQPNDLAWRETFDAAGSDLYGPFAAALLDPARGGTAASRTAEAFAELQRFRSRTLEDALRGTEARQVVPRVSLAELQRVLRPGETVLDVFAAGDTTFVFAVTRDGIRIGAAAGGAKLVPRLSRFRDALASAGVDEAMLASAAASLGQDLLGPVAELLRRSPTLLVSAGSLTAFPLGMLRLPGESEPLASLHQVAIIPSATVLAGARGARVRAPAHTGLVALSRTTNVEGVRLEGVADESRWLAHRFARSRVRANDGTQPLEKMVGEVGAGDVLHIASHARVPATSPWRAGLLLGRGAGEDAYLTASRITRLRPSARLCVMASCSSAGASTGAEGLPNLASAWLEAGVRTVIATQWKVDDRATARFVQDLYEGLARGRTAGEALAEAQRAARASGERRAPRDWGGFVLVGDPTTRVAFAGAPATPASGARPPAARR